jgi:hypothetical protein
LLYEMPASELSNVWRPVRCIHVLLGYSSPVHILYACLHVLLPSELQMLLLFSLYKKSVSHFMHSDNCIYRREGKSGGWGRRNGDSCKIISKKKNVCILLSYLKALRELAVRIINTAMFLDMKASRLVLAVAVSVSVSVTRLVHTHSNQSLVEKLIVVDLVKDLPPPPLHGPLSFITVSTGAHHWPCPATSSHSHARHF